MQRSVQSAEDLVRLLDTLFASAADRPSGDARWWDTFYGDRDRDVPFFCADPDESLVTWHGEARLPDARGRRALDLGCGPGRNSVWLARQGYQVDAIDFSPSALKWGQERAGAAQVEVNFVQADIFGWNAQAYDLVYDSGCFHHLAPHRRVTYRELLERTLAPGGTFGLAAFAAGAHMGSDAPDEAFYRPGRPTGGIAYSDADLRGTFAWLDEVELRRMRQVEPDSGLFGVRYLWAGLFRRRA